MTADGLRALEVRVAGRASQASGVIRLSLVDETWDGSEVVRIGEVDSGLAVRTSALRWEFPPIANSKGRMYRLDISSPDQTGVALWATKGWRYEYGRLFVNGNWRWADLSFRADAPVRSVLSLLVSPASRPPVQGMAVLAAMCIAWLLLGMTLNALPVRSESSRP
jgi:hypothetical protein